MALFSLARLRAGAADYDADLILEEWPEAPIGNGHTAEDVTTWLQDPSNAKLLIAVSGTDPEIPPESEGWQIYNLRDAYAPRPPIEWVVKGLFPIPSLSIVYAPPGCFKTMLLADQATNGTKAHTWLNQAQVKELLEACEVRRSGNPEFEIVAQRDRLAIGLLVAAGLRRKEAVDLTFDNVKLQPNGEKMRTVLEIQGKGDKGRVVPISDALANAIDSWAAVVGNEGRILRSLGRSKTPGDSMTTTALYDLVQKRGELIGKPDLQPHDLRRTFAQLGYEAGIPITQLSKLLGHASIETTQRYLNLDLDLGTTASDFIPFFG
jgi:integrase